MKYLRSFFATVLVICLLFSLSGCHKKGEVALTADGYDITAGMYSYYLTMADSDAKALISSSDEYDVSAKGFSYLKQNIDGKSYSTYVKELAITKCLEAIAYQKLCDDNKITLTDEMIENGNYQAELYWDYYGYSSVLEPNGISLETYKKAILNTLYSDAYFKHLYDKDGEKAISDKDISDTLVDKFAAVYMLNKNYSSDSTADATKLEKDFNDYKARLEKGEDFEKIYNEFNGIKEDATKEEESEDDDTPSAKDDLIQIIGAKDTFVEFEHFDKAKALKEGAIEVIHDTTNKQLYLLVKKDISADSYYKDEYLKTEIMYLLKGDEYDKLIDEKVKALEYTTDSRVIDLFKVKNIADGTN